METSLSFFSIEEDTIQQIENILPQQFSILQGSIDFKATADVNVVNAGPDKLRALELCRKIKQKNLGQIIILTPINSNEHLLQWAEIGVDGLLFMPAQPDEIVSHINYLLNNRIKRKSNDFQISIDDIFIDFEERQIMRSGKYIDLSKSQFELLTLFLKYANKLLTPQRIAEELWGDVDIRETNAVVVAVKRLKDKIDSPFETKFIYSRRGYGYIFKTTEERIVQQ